ncbi:hypothetical protein BS50DRAFT_580767 [Corynespora cassiicola Philippines]|uniref:Uncharacterized protein n=1 Tax=Corynespora cassiicola Philippines TaxID=1448308 RepID=A0A2T2P8B7_CORCC|nr:hypothetical protein BS50DRAFT_580767 [Corynespora cassiicola Philippines]
MCKVAKLHFVCGHHADTLKSRCRGTYHRKRKYDTMGAACTADAYLMLKLPYDCAACNQSQWNSGWQAKITRAKNFLARLSSSSSSVGAMAEAAAAATGSLPGARQVARLVQELEDEYARRSWEVRSGTALLKGHVQRPKLGFRLQAGSPLRYAVQPEDVAVADEQQGGDENLQGASDGGEGSADPFHPMSTDYEAIYADYDDAAGETSSEGAFNAEEETWTWGDDTPEVEGETTTTSDWGSFEDTTMTATGLTAWGPDASWSETSFRVERLTITQEEEEEEEEEEEDEDEASKKRTAQVIEAFWKVVNEEPVSSSTRVSSPPFPPSSPSSYSSSSPSSSSSSTTTTPPHTPSALDPDPEPTFSHFTDGPSDTPHPLSTPLLSPSSRSSMSPPTITTTTTTATNPHLSRWGQKVLAELARRRPHDDDDDDPDRYFAKYLAVWRFEVQKCEWARGGVGPRDPGRGGMR